MDVRTEPPVALLAQYYTDPLTGFGTRAALMEDLAEVVGPDAPPSAVAIFALEGLGEYGAFHGDLARERVVARLAERLATKLGPPGSCYRPRNDEFIALIAAPLAEVIPLLDASAATLRERDRYVTITASFGAALLPDEASEPIEALRIADERLSSNSPRRRPRRRQRNW
jgi:two-component system cell cycle response regulator